MRLAPIARPWIGPTEVLVATRRSVLSAGTERAVRRLAAVGLVRKARARPDLVREVIRKARAEGISSTLHAVRSRLDDELPLGYSGAGVAIEVGAAVEGIVPGQRVATGGAGHGDLQVVPGLLTVPIPDEVSDDEAAFATISAIALNALRLAELGPGARACVIGLGLLGQLTVRLLHSAGVMVAGIDVAPWAVDRARASGAMALVEQGEATTNAVVEWSGGRGVDAILVTAATASSEPVTRAPAIARDRATVVVVGDVGLELARTPLYDKELTLRFARSYGPGRYDMAYERWGVDYPAGYVPFTERRNLETFLSLVAAGRLQVTDLVTHRYPLEEIEDAYALLERRDEPHLGVLITYDRNDDRTWERSAARPRPPRPIDARTGDRLGLIGYGVFARSTLLPAATQAGFRTLVAVASAAGRSATRAVAEAGFQRAVSDPAEVIAADDVDVIMIATPHSSHASFVVAALEAGKHVFCEKPLALSEDELGAVAEAWCRSAAQLAVGFNRRHAPAIRLAREHLGQRGGPLVLTYRVNAGRLPDRHWYHDRREGGRLLGEVCHFLDTCAAIVGAAPTEVLAMGSGRGERLLEDDLVVTVRYADGSVATISYAAGGSPRSPKERLEVLGRGHSVVIEDFRRVILDERVARRGPQDKGHRRELQHFHDCIVSGQRCASAVQSAFETTAVTLAAAASLLSGQVTTPTMP